MTSEEKKQLLEDIRINVKSVTDAISRYIQNKSNKEISVDELGKLADMLKDCAKALKDIGKAHYYEAEHPTETVKI